MTILTLEVDVRFSADIREAAAEAVRLADLLGCNVRFDFNGIPCFACPGATAEQLVGFWSTALGGEIAYRDRAAAGTLVPTPKPGVKK